MGGHTKLHPQLHLHYSPTAPANHAKDTGDGKHVYVPPRVVPTALLDKLLPLQEKMNTALEQLLTNMAIRDLHCKELDLNMKVVACLNEAQVAEAIKQVTEAIQQAEMHHATTACALKQAHRDSVLDLEHQTNVEGMQDHQAFMEAFGVAIEAC